MSTPVASLQVVYECAECGQRLLERRCPDCNLFTRRLGPGGCCPHCAEPITLDDLVDGT
jgi:predicted amidophosphoribosyltransferase